MVERLDELEHERAWPRSSAAAAEGWNHSWEENTARQFDPAPPPRIYVAEENKRNETMQCVDGEGCFILPAVLSPPPPSFVVVDVCGKYSMA